MRVALDVGFLSFSLKSKVRRTGVYRYIHDMGLALSGQLHENLSFFVTEPLELLQATYDYLQTHENLKQIAIPQYSNAKINPEKYLDPYYYPENVDIVHYPQQTHFRPFACPEKKTIFFHTVHDLIPFVHPEFYDCKGMSHLIGFANKLTYHDWIICPSQDTKDDLCRYCSVDPNKVFAIHHSISSEDFYPCTDEALFNEMKQKYNIPDQPYLLCIGRLEERKNTQHIITTFLQFLEEEKLKDLYLVFCGPLTGMSNDIVHLFQTYVSSHPMRSHIIHIPYIEDRYLNSIYSHALVTLFLPIYEGFGFPLLESMQCATPLIASNISSIPEIVQDAGILIATDDSDVLKQHILNFYHSSALRDEWIQKGLKRVAEFSKRKQLDQILQAYQTAIEHHHL